MRAIGVLKSSLLMGGLTASMLCLGCSDSPSSKPKVSRSQPAATSQAAAKEALPATPTKEISATVSTFLSAIIAGDTPGATECLTPLAINQFRTSGKPFDPPGLTSAKFQIGRIHQETADEAAVQCLLSTPDAQGQQEELCCIVRKVNSDWRIAGLAYEAGADQPPVILDFETPERMSQPAKARQQRFVESTLGNDGERTAQAPGEETSPAGGALR